jgi:gamma-glutamylaminecyclotransferase
MRHRVFVYGTLLRGEVNHHLLAGAQFLGPHHTEACYTLYNLGAYPGLSRGGRSAIAGEVYRVGDAALNQLDRLEECPRLYDRVLIPSPYGRAWIYIYRGRLKDRPVIPSGDWRTVTADADSWNAAAVRTKRDSKNPQWRMRITPDAGFRRCWRSPRGGLTCPAR